MLVPLVTRAPHPTHARKLYCGGTPASREGPHPRGPYHTRAVLQGCVSALARAAAPAVLDKAHTLEETSPGVAPWHAATPMQLCMHTHQIPGPGGAERRRSG